MPFRLSRAVAAALLWACAALPAAAQLNVNLLGQLGYAEDLSDIWGWTDPLSGDEYALVGVYDGFSIVDVSDPANPVEVQFIPGTPTIWRDVKTFGHYAYVTNEGGGGLLIVDLSGLPASAPTWTWTGGVGFSTAHNIFMDENGVAYLCGSNGSLGTLFLDCAANPTNPPLLGSYTLRYVHDLYVRGDTMWTSEVYDGIFSVVDVTNKAAPSVMATQSTTSDFTHNCWLSDDGATLFTTDEVSSANIDAYDVSDLGDIRRLDTWKSNPGSGVIPHNAFVVGDFVVTAYYRDGVTITDATRPDNMILTGFYDTSPFSGDGFNGAWGVYPYFPSGLVVASDIEEGLFCLGVTYAQAAYLAGTVTDSLTGAPLAGATVEILAAPDTDPAGTDLFGGYATGTAFPGSYTVRVSAFGYGSKEFPATALVSGVETVLDAELVALPTFELAGAVIDSVTRQPVPFASLLLEVAGTAFPLTADAGGQFSLPGALPGEYAVHAGAWGWRTKAFGPLNLDAGTGAVTLELNRGWYDDALFDFGWTTASTAATGAWTRDEPVGTFSGGLVNVDRDAEADFGSLAWVTGNGGGSAGSDDVDDGVVTLRSPAFDVSRMGNPRFRFAIYYYNGGGFGPPDDTLFVRVHDGSTSAVVHQRNPGQSSGGNWFTVNAALPAGIDASAPLTFSVQAADREEGGGHLVEAGLDHWRVVDLAANAAPAAALETDAFCANEPVAFHDASTGFPGTWWWTFEDGSPATSADPDPVVSFPGPGTYAVTLTVYNGVATSTTTSSVTIGAPLDLAVSGTAPTPGASDGTVTVDGTTGGVPPYTYVWDDPSASTGETVSGLPAGTWTCTVTDANGCTATASVMLGTVGLGTTALPAPTAGPNPFAGQATARVPDGTPMDWEAFDAAGRRVEAGRWSPGAHVLGADWAPGAYTLRWRAADGRAGTIALVKGQP